MIQTTNKFFIHLLAIFLLVWSISVPSPNVYAAETIKANSQEIFWGAQKSIGMGKVTSWIKVDAAQKPVSIGITLTEDAVATTPANDQAPAGVDGIKLKLRDGIGHQTFEYEVNLPKISSVPFSHVGVNWNPFGHGPEGIFTPAHWDIHFYTIDPEYRHQIKQDTAEDVNKSNKELPNGFLNTDYKLAPGTAEPRMGSHTADFSSPQLLPGKFDNIFIIGIYNGEVVHWEPMITDNFLKSNLLAVEKIKLPDLYFKSGYYPTEYTIKHDQKAREYKISLDNLVYREAYNAQHF